MSAVQVSLLDPSSVLVPDVGGSDGNLINSLRDDCGYVIQGIDWVLRQVNIDLIATIFEPIAGDFDAVGSMAANWGTMGVGLGQVGTNYQSIASATPAVWEGDAATAAIGRMAEFADSFATQQEACRLIEIAMRDMMAATRSVVELVASLLSMVDELVLTLLASAIKLAKELATGGATIRKIISLVSQAIKAIDTLTDLIPDLLRACAALSAMFKVLKDIYKFSGGVANTVSGHQADDVAESGF